MTQKVRFITIVALGFSVLAGTAATVQSISSTPTNVVVSADGPDAPAQVGQPVTPPAPAPAASPTPSPLPTGPQETWGWG
ncbi:hypothetical protein [Kitasatospora sp. NPDC002040]|uniref:hypothetical protein n=1 Tax=Kitasatospora sp. NPDC002040 TaxID=3154661 RepID=UPI00332A6EB5